MSEDTLPEEAIAEPSAAEALLSEANLSCYTRRDGRRAVLVFEGTLDIATAPKAARAIHEFLEHEGSTLILDLSRMDFIDSKGVGCLLSAAKAARDAGGGLYLPEPAMPVRKILDMCGLSSLFPASPPTPKLEVTAAEVATKPGLRTAERAPAARPLKRAA